MKKHKTYRGFTLIELLVVIAIIGVLSAVVISSLNSARSKAKDTLIKQEFSQIATLMALNYDEYGSYCNLQSGGVFISRDGVCDTRFSGIYANKAREICNNIYNNAGDFDTPGGEHKILTYLEGTTCSTSYSWAVQLNNNKWYCMGSTSKSESTNYWDAPGCYMNP